MERLQRLLTSIPFQRLANKRAVSAFFGWLANCRLPHQWLLRLIHAFVRAFDIDLDEYDLDLQRIRTFNEFFARPLKEGARSFQGTICAPADGLLSSFGAVKDGLLFQVKGKPYALRDLLQAEPAFEARSFMTLYLSLGDYHRVHLPFNATLTSIRHLPGTLYSLSPATLGAIDRVYCRNERLVLEGMSASGRFYLVFVGALVVGAIVLHKNAILNAELKQGVEIGHFRMGSSVLLLLESDELSTLPYDLNTHLKTGESVC